MMQKEDGSVVELTDDEKMRASRILLLILVVLLKGFVKDMTADQVNEKKKQVEDRFVKGSAGKNIGGLS